MGPLAAERNYTIGEQVLLAVIHALKKWRVHLEGAKHPVRVRTDHQPLTYLPTKGALGSRQVKWSEYLARFDLEWECILGSNCHTLLSGGWHAFRVEGVLLQRATPEVPGSMLQIHISGKVLWRCALSAALARHPVVLFRLGIRTPARLAQEGATWS